MADTPIADYRTRMIAERLADERFPTGTSPEQLIEAVREVLASAFVEAYERSGHGENDPDMWLWFAAYEARRALNAADGRARTLDESDYGDEGSPR